MHWPSRFGTVKSDDSTILAGTFNDCISCHTPWLNISMSLFSAVAGRRVHSLDWLRA